MKKTWSILFALVMLAAFTASGVCETLYVDNRETDKVYPERLNLRDEPSKEGGLLGLYYTGTQVEVISTDDAAYTQVEVGGVTGYMASDYLITAEEAAARYGDDSGFYAGREAEIDLIGMWQNEVSLLDHAQEDAETIAALQSGDDVEIMGILGDEWAYVAADVNGVRTLGYIPLDVLTDVGERKVLVVAGKKADSQTNLYETPSEKAEPIMALKNGTTCLSVFGRTVGKWRKVRVGGVTGWIKATQTSNLYELGSQARSVVPYYPLQMQAKNDALLLRVRNDKSQRYMTLGQEMKVEVLAECGDSVYVRTLEGGAGAYDCGDYGYMSLGDLSLTVAGTGLGVAQADDGDLPVVVYAQAQADAQIIGALCSGAQVRITAFTQTDYVQIALGDVSGYIAKNEIRVLSSAEDEVSQRIPQRATAVRDVALCSAMSDQSVGDAQVKSGDRVYMLAKCGDWAFVRASDKPGLDMEESEPDLTGFVPLSALSAPASTTHLTAYVTIDKVNLREQAGKDGDIIGKARLEERLRVADYGTQWTCVVKPDGKRGYIMTQYLQFE